MVYKRRNRTGAIVWAYRFDVPGEGRARVSAGGFATKKLATDAEAARRLEVKAEIEARSKAPIKTLSGVLAEFFEDSPDLAPKTLERYRQLAAYLHPDLAALPIAEVSALILHHEWKRLAESGGHDRKERKPRALSAKTIRNICGVVSAAFGWARRYGLTAANPTRDSDPPKVARREAQVFVPSTQQIMVEAARIHWMPAFLELAAATGCRRGELLATEWRDLNGSDLYIRGSLCQTKAGLIFKSTKGGKPRLVNLPKSALDALEFHRKQQSVFRAEFPDYTGDLIFANPDGTPLRPDSVSAAVSRLCRRLKLPKGSSLHTMRHSLGSQMLKAGVPITDVAKQLGHSSPRTTMTVYAHALENEGAAAVKRWEEWREQSIDRKPTRQ